ncbi:TatD family deoxyribonuclease [Vibrio sp. S17_S38]|uniref:TatD family hydrolase n=1 Tax=Vibrio sp. S17_S38 TaxID=2720229 RepID=UPI001680078A|nr:TatD family hydrolase [Vibrio sp. S17_S38]MBD1571956.1 TatD family deoxyribonuclease [Vibrio sp. S17_S38]
MTFSYSFVDTHCHFDFPAFKQTQKHLNIANDAGVSKIIIPSVGESNWLEIKTLCDQFSPLYYSLGLHPYFIKHHEDDALENLKQALSSRSKQCVAIGECGLDFMLEPLLLTPDMIQKQSLLFEAQVALAAELHLPLILHSRKAHDQVLKILRLYKPQKGGVIHAFSGSYQQAMEYIKLGFYIGVGGIITYPRAKKTRETILRIPLNSVVLETDAPDMPLNGFQGEDNHPAKISLVFDALFHLRGEVREESREVIAKQVWLNSHQLFSLD